MSKQAALTDTKQPQPKKPTPTTIPAALTHDQGPPKIETPTQPIKPTPKPTPTTTQQKPQTPIPKETKLLCDFLEELEGAAYHLRQALYQLYGPVNYNYITDIELQFTEQQAKQLTFTEQNGNWIIKPKYHLEKQTFAGIASKVTELGGLYVSAGADSHFIIKRS